jgi:hypothetical protein
VPSERACGGARAVTLTKVLTSSMCLRGRVAEVCFRCTTYPNPTQTANSDQRQARNTPVSECRTSSDRPAQIRPLGHRPLAARQRRVHTSRAVEAVIAEHLGAQSIEAGP